VQSLKGSGGISRISERFPREPESRKQVEMADKQSKKANKNDDIITIKKYANRRLYNTATSSYVTLDYLAEMVKRGEKFAVYDAKSGEDITRSVLTQIIFEEENKGQNMLPVNFLRQLISYYGDSLQGFVPSYLEMTMESFQRNQEAMRASASETLSAAPGLKMFEEVSKKNMEMFEQSMKMWGMGSGAFAGAASSGASASDGDIQNEISALKEEIASLRKKLQQREDQD
jgi:polyhydroxyalkanoate synthesis repressor PhaR